MDELYYIDDVKEIEDLDTIEMLCEFKQTTPGIY